MKDNRGQDIKLIKLAIKIEKDACQFFTKFIEKTGESSLGTFLQQINEEIAEDLSRFEDSLKSLENGEEGNIEDMSLEDYKRESTRGDKFFPSGRITELLEGAFNPINVLGTCSQIMKDLAKYYGESANDIFYDTEKGLFQEIAERKKEQSDMIGRKKREIISRFP